MKALEYQYDLFGGHVEFQNLKDGVDRIEKGLGETRRGLFARYGKLEKANERMKGELDTLYLRMEKLELMLAEKKRKKKIVDLDFTAHPAPFVSPDDDELVRVKG